MKLDTPHKEKPFNWIEGFEGIYLMNEDKQIKKARVKIIKGNKKELQEASYLTIVKNEKEELTVELINSKGKPQTYLIADLKVVKYTRARVDPTHKEDAVKARRR